MFTKVFVLIFSSIFLLSSVALADIKILSCVDNQRHKSIEVTQMLPEDHKQARFLVINYFFQQIDGYLYYMDGEIIRDLSGQVSKIELKSERLDDSEKWTLDVASGKISVEGVWSHWNSDKFIADLTDLRCQSF